MNTVADATTALKRHASEAVACDVGRLDYPTLYIVASDISGSGQRQYVWLVRLDLALIVLAAAFGAASQFVAATWGSIVAIPIVVFLLASVIVRAVGALGDHDRRWFNGRAVAESVKTTAWRYMMRVNPYNTDNASDEQQLNATLRDILDSAISLHEEIADVPGVRITPRMRQVRMLSLAARKTCYLKERVDDQIAWYGAKSESNRRLARVWFWVGILAQGAALISALFGILNPDALAFVGLFAAAAAAATASLQLRRHDELAKSYAVAAQELGHLKMLIERTRREAAFQVLVDDTESAISREHTLWVAKRGRSSLAVNA